MNKQPNIYDQHWDARAYLRHYYSQAFIPDDEEAIYQRLIPYFQQRGQQRAQHGGRRFARALDFGCGPTLHHLNLLAPWADELHAADYLPGNLQEIQRWLRAEPEAHDWDLKIRRVIEVETQAAVTDAMLAARKALLRQRLTTLKPCDVRQADPLGDGSQYDLLFSAYCVDAASDSAAEWRLWMQNLLTLCRDDGVVLLVSSSKARQYRIGNQLFPEANIDANDMSAALLAAGFSPQRIRLETVAIKDWAEDAFNAITIAIAEKGAAREGDATAV
ncbi:MAG: hypothetical protein HYR56_05170 [Acidobacteria bacterium]|nr:hypothetical protein [Acidobacteriota bacterium]MBI3423641.1 hypothetical protein [Acidobacteriota bacterium]